MPNGAKTPGAINVSVTQENLQSTICVSGYTATIRPSSSYTTSLKKKQLASGYAYKGDLNTSDYEEDHLISLELGGSPTDAKNLWPEPYVGTTGARVKDQVENKLHSLVCSGVIALSVAQIAIATNWWDAYSIYVLGKGVTPSPVPSRTLSPSPTPSPTSPPTTAPSISPLPSPVATIAPIPLPSSSSPSNQLPIISAGSFCASSLAGQQGRNASGVVYTCKVSATDSRLRWRQ
jgi:hypothetical protein